MPVIVEQLPGNDLPLPAYHSQHAAAMDFPVCLRRPITEVTYGVMGECSKRKFIAEKLDLMSTGRRWLDQDTDFIANLNVPAPELVIHPGEILLVPLGVKFEFSRDFVLCLYVRSSTSLRGLTLANKVAVVDPDYRGEISAALTVLGEYTKGAPVRIKHGQRLIQGVLHHFTTGVIQAGTVSDTTRGDGGFGSTG